MNRSASALCQGPGACARSYQSIVDHLHGHLPWLLKDDHEIRRLDIPMNEPLPIAGAQSAGDLVHNLQSQPHFQGTTRSEYVVERFSLHELHRIEVIALDRPKVEYRSHIRVAQTGSSSRLS